MCINNRVDTRNYDKVRYQFFKRKWNHYFHMHFIIKQYK